MMKKTDYFNPWKVFGYVSLLYFFYSMFGILMSFLLVGSLVYFTDGVKDLKFVKKVIARDCYWFWKFVAVFLPTVAKNIKKTPNQLVTETIQRHPNKKALIDAETGRSLTFNDVQIFINKIGHVFKNSGFNPGDKVALLIDNELEYIPIWLGLNKVGVQVGLINFNLHGKSLEHCLTVVNFKAIICSSSLTSILKDIGFLDNSKYQIFVFEDDKTPIDFNGKNLQSLMKEVPGESPEEHLFAPMETCILMYTSGSTGRPKAAKLAKEKMMQFLILFPLFPDLKPDDVAYNTLPLYHASGGLVFASQWCFKGCTTIIRKKFSASKFFTDCIKYDVTYVGYIGELWKYLLSQPPRDTDRNHKIQKALGNGLRSNMVPVIKERFGIDQIYEFYGATEGNAGLMNMDNVPGAVGFYFILFPFFNKSCLVRADVETGEIIRDDNGRAIRCKPGEVGTFIGIVNSQANYYGYANNEKESNKKLRQNIFKEGDSAFISGDLLVMDEYRNVFFVDRVGDTFRWRGENVATTEVENIMSSVVSSAEDVVVYPVPIPGEGGNAGMAYIREKESQQFSIKGVAKGLLEELPKYAIPMFIRVGRNLDQTGTFKYQKSSLKKQKYDLNSCNKDDVVYVYDVTKKDYIILDSELQENIENGKMRF